MLHLVDTTTTTTTDSSPLDQLVKMISSASAGATTGPNFTATQG
ncbi:hypothetical protein [Speluncibacter jeojiensis]|nr:hypothetical protein [Rhodococcus sp. D2-41]